MPRIHRPTAQRREEILDAAHTLFTTKGFQPTTMEDILRIVGIAKGTLYYHFPSKEQILKALVLRIVHQVEQQAREIATSSAPAADKLAAIEEEPDQAHYLLLHGAIHALATGAHRPALVVDSYILRAMALHGWGLSLYECAVCGRGEGLAAFHLQSGGVVCSDCAPRAAAYPAPETVELLGSLVSGRWDVADAAGEHDRRAASAIVAAYLQWHVERKVRSLRIAESA